MSTGDGFTQNEVEQRFFVAALIPTMVDAVYQQLTEQIDDGRIIRKPEIASLVSLAAGVVLKQKWGEVGQRLVDEYLVSMAQMLEELSDDAEIKNEVVGSYKQYVDLYNEGNDSYSVIEALFATKVVSGGEIVTDGVLKLAIQTLEGMDC